eukprot:3181242-Rhodomonas_salina.1
MPDKSAHALAVRTSACPLCGTELAYAFRHVTAQASRATSASPSRAERLRTHLLTSSLSLSLLPFSPSLVPSFSLSLLLLLPSSSLSLFPLAPSSLQATGGANCEAGASPPPPPPPQQQQQQQQQQQ